jgi:hypothetical protein
MMLMDMIGGRDGRPRREFNEKRVFEKVPPVNLEKATSSGTPSANRRHV